MILNRPPPAPSSSSSSSLTQKLKSPILHPIPIDQTHSTSFQAQPNQQGGKIYVLSSDGSSLFLIDPSRPPTHEKPPSYSSLIVGENTQSQGHVGGSSRSFPPTSGEGVGDSSEEVLIGPAGDQASSTGHSARETAGRSDLTATRLPSSIPPNVSTTSSSGNRTNRSQPQPQQQTPERSLSYHHQYHTSPNSVSPPSMDENTPLLASFPLDGNHRSTQSSASGMTPYRYRNRISFPAGDTGARGFWRSILFGEYHAATVSHSGQNGPGFWEPVTNSEYWLAAFHLLLLNFPFALLVWPPLLIGTIVGTALLITLPLAVVVWWLTLIIARSAARLETIMQFHHHGRSGEMMVERPTYHPIFHRIKEPEPVMQSVNGLDPGYETPILWEKSLIKCSWAMFCDHSSYSALSYLLLIKPVLTLLSTIILLTLFPIAVISILGLPVYLRMTRRWGRWQARVAFDNLS